MNIELNYVHRFREKFNIGETLSVEAFDQWCIDVGLIDDPGTEDKQTAEWALLLKQRNNARVSLNKKAAISEIEPENRYSVDFVSLGSYEVRALADSLQVQQDLLPEKLGQYFDGQNTKIKLLLKQAESVILTDATRIRIDALEEQREDFKEEIAQAIARAGRKFHRTARAVELALEKPKLGQEHLSEITQKVLEKL
jgi:hypothetical protein